MYNNHRSKLKSAIYFIIYILVVTAMGYGFPREDFGAQLLCFALAFAVYILLIREFGNYSQRYWQLIMGALFLRSVFFVAIPILSDDFYRYIFDGQLLRNGINPYSFLPQEAFEKIKMAPNDYWNLLLIQMNSPSYFSVYPPFHQVVFWISAMMGENLIYNIIAIRLILIASDIFNIFLIWKITKEFGIPNKATWIYAFNPLVIIEISGNLHFEGMVLTGLLFSIYGFCKNKQLLASSGWSLAVGLKLTPLIIGPLWLKAWSINKLIPFLFFAGFLFALLFLPLAIGNGWTGFWNSLRLYQSNFEFNASVYYLFREVFSFFLGYNPIAYLGPALNLITLMGILVFVYFWKLKNPINLAEGVFWIYLIFLLLQPVVHPWYLIPGFGISVLTKYRVFLIWTFLVFLSYAAYSYPVVKESWLLLGIEYGVLFGYLGYKITQKMR